jgi:Uma2 family endonuclease
VNLFLQCCCAESTVSKKCLDISLVGGSSTTFQRQELASGFEPDACFYIAHAAQVRGKKRINLAKDPPPDLVIEIDITSPALKKFPIFAALQVPEVWRYAAETITLHKFVEGDYAELASSEALPGVTGAALAQLLVASQQLTRTAWLRQVRAYGQTLAPAKPGL